MGHILHLQFESLTLRYGHGKRNNYTTMMGGLWTFRAVKQSIYEEFTSLNVQEPNYGLLERNSE